MTNRNLLKTTVLVALAAAPFLVSTASSTLAQRAVAASCPKDYTLSGNVCIRKAPAPVPTCPSGYSFSAGKCVTNTAELKTATREFKPAKKSQWAFITREAFGVKTAKELDGANFCAEKGQQADDAASFFKAHDLNATHVAVDNNRVGIKTYQQYDCDILVVLDQVASKTAKSLEPKDGHVVLPERFGEAKVVSKPVAVPAVPVAKATPAPAPVVTPAPVPHSPKPPAAVQKTPAKKKVVRRKPRCSAIRYAYSRGNTCACAGGRVFTGRSCARPRWF